MIENWQNELYQLENKQSRGAKLRTNIRQEMEFQNVFQID